MLLELGTLASEFGEAWAFEGRERLLIPQIEIERCVGSIILMIFPKSSIGK